MKAFFCPFTLVAWFIASPAMAQDIAGSADSAAAADRPAAGYEQKLQVWVGGLDTDDGWTRDDVPPGEDLSGDFGTLPYFGGAGQRLWGAGVMIGFEGGGLVTWKNDSTKFYATNGTLRVEIDNTLVSVEFFLGGMLSVQPVRWLRVYAAAGPAVAYAYLNDDDDDPEVAPNGDVSANSGRNVEFSSEGHSLSFTLYGRAGFEFETPGGITFGAHARYAPHEFDFDDGGKLDLDEIQYFLTVGARL